MKECANCDYHIDGACTCSPSDSWYACPIENKKPENIKALKEYAEWAYKAESENATNLCNQCTNERCVFASGICRNDCEFFIAKESEDKDE